MAGNSKHSAHDSSEDYTREKFMIKPAGPWSSAWKIAAGAGLLGVILCAVGAMQSPEGGKRFAFSYLFAFFAVLMVALGSVFFVIIQRLTVAHWSVTVRRVSEFFVSGLPVFALLALPIIANFGKLYPMLAPPETEHHAAVSGAILENEAHAAQAPAEVVPAAGHDVGAHGAAHTEAAGAAVAGTEAGHAEGHAAAHESHDPHHVIHLETLAKKSAWFEPKFVYGRAAFYLLVWVILGTAFFKMSVDQDGTKSVVHTLKAQRYAPIGMVFFGLSLTFAAFDWVMALEPAWFSTIFGVYVFSGGVVAGLAVLILTVMALRDAGYLSKVVTIEHFHDLGKLMFGFNCFWAYIAFSQFMLIWYAALPEETTFYHLRGAGPESHGMWGPVGLLLIAGHFIFPFFWLISRHAKRTHLGRLKFGAMWLLAMHVIEWYWFVMPNLTPKGVEFHFLDIGALLAVGGIYFAVVFYRMTKHPLIPVGDPRLMRSIHHFNA